MAVNSFNFILFFTVTAAVYLNLPKRLQNAFLLLASLVFYLFGAPEYLAALMATVLFNYYGGKLISESGTEARKKRWAAIFIALNIAVLAAFKYCGFLVELIRPLTALLGFSIPLPAWAAPLGISYYTLMVIGYFVDLCRGKVLWDRDFDGFWDFALYLSFFPHITAGPFGRADELLPQYRLEHRFDYGRTVWGMQRFLMGAVKKVVISDGLAMFTGAVFGTLPSKMAAVAADTPELLSKMTVYAESGQLLILSHLLFVIQLFADFSGYSDMAVGTARILGIELRENFNAPYFSPSFTGFWRRWHMSLSAWLRDYIYIPLGGNRRGRPRKYLNIMIVYVLCGFWHTPTWNFVLWGVSLGVIVIFEDLAAGKKILENPRSGNKPLKLFRHGYTMVLFTLTLLFVTSGTPGDLVYMVRQSFRFSPIGELKLQFLEISGGTIATTGTYLALFWGGIGLASALAIWMDFRLYKSGRDGASPEFNQLGTLSKRKRWVIYFVSGGLVMFFYLVTTSGGIPSFFYGGF